MSKHYTVILNDGTEITRARKDAAKKVAEESGQSWQLYSPSGAILEASEMEPYAPASEPEPEFTPAPEPEASSVPETDEEAALPVPSKPVDIEKMKKRIALLLNKAERTDNEHERDTFMAAAETMMVRLGIGRAQLESVGEVKPEEIVEVKREWHGNYSIALIPFTYSLAGGFGNITVLHSDYGAPMRRTSYIIGHKSDVEEFLRLLESCFLQVMSALKRWQREHRDERRYLTDMQKYVQHRSFITGFGAQVGQRLGDLRHKEEEYTDPGTALVLASKIEKVVAWRDEKYPNIKSAKGGMQYHSSIGSLAGQRAGKEANLTNQKELSS